LNVASLNTKKSNNKSVINGYYNLQFIVYGWSKNRMLRDLADSNKRVSKIPHLSLYLTNEQRYIAL